MRPCPEHGPVLPWRLASTAEPCTQVRIANYQRENIRCKGGRARERGQREEVDAHFLGSTSSQANSASNPFGSTVEEGALGQIIKGKHVIRETPERAVVPIGLSPGCFLN